MLAGAGMQIVEILNGTKAFGEGSTVLEEATLVREDTLGLNGDQPNKEDMSLQYDITALANAAAIMTIALALKKRLMKAYGVTEDKAVKFKLGKRTAASDKPTVRRSEAGLPLDWTGLSGITEPSKTIQDYECQVKAVSLSE